MGHSPKRSCCGEKTRGFAGIRSGFASVLYQRVPENEVALGRSPEDSQEDSQRIREDSHVFWRIRVRNPCLFCGFLKDSNETTIPFYNIKRVEVALDRSSALAF